MKKLFPPACCLCMILAGLSIDASAQGKIALGLKAGVNFANAALDPNDWAKKSARMGFLFGGIVEYTINSMVALQAQPAYCQRGVVLEETSRGTDIKATLKLDYFEIPLLVKLTFGSTELKPYVFAGPNVAILLSAKNKLEVGGNTQEEDIEKDTFSSTDMGLDIGAGIGYWLKSNMGLFLDARYSLGLTDVDNSAVDATYKSGDIKITAGLLFRMQ
jgi:hypothetical protein